MREVRVEVVDAVDRARLPGAAGVPADDVEVVEQVAAEGGVACVDQRGAGEARAAGVDEQRTDLVALVGGRVALEGELDRALGRVGVVERDLEVAHCEAVAAGASRACHGQRRGWRRRTRGAGLPARASMLVPSDAGRARAGRGRGARAAGRRRRARDLDRAARPGARRDARGRATTTGDGGGHARQPMLRGGAELRRRSRPRSLAQRGERMRMGPHSCIGTDPERVKGVDARGQRAPAGLGLRPALPLADRRLPGHHRRRRAARPVPPLLFRAILDTAIPEGDRTLVVVLASITVLVALVDAGLGIVQRWYSATDRRGHDPRPARSPCSTRCSACRSRSSPARRPARSISRLNNDVIGAQDAVTGTLGSVVSATSSCSCTTLIAMLRARVAADAARPRRAAALHHPGQAGRPRLQAISREQMDINAEMNTQMTERFNVAGALLVKLFGSYGRRGRRVRRARRPGPRHRHRVGDVRPGVLRRPRPGGRHRRGRRLRRRRPAGDQRRHLDRHAGRAGGLRHPDLQAAHRASPTPAST